MKKIANFTKVKDAFYKVVDMYRENRKSLVIIISVITTLMLGVLFKNNIQSLEHIMQNKNEIKDLLRNFGPLGPLIVILFQILQVVIFFIPGEVFQTTAGYAYGTWLGTLLCIVGMDIGGAILFIATKKYGKGLVNKFIPQKVSDSFDKLLQSEKINFIVFLMYIIPGIPKDGSILLCGLSRINLKDFLIYSTLGRLPALIISCYYGANLALGNTNIVITMTILCLVIVGASYFFKENIYKRLQSVN